MEPIYWVLILAVAVVIVPLMVWSLNRDKRIMASLPQPEPSAHDLELPASNATEHEPVKRSGGKKLVWSMVALAALVVLAACEWRYSSDMQGHIDDVNRDIERVSLRSSYSMGLIGSLQTMTEETEVAKEIIETHEYVHTFKDWMLARRIKDAASSGITVGGAIHNVLAAWSQSVAHPEKS